MVAAIEDEPFQVTQKKVLLISLAFPPTPQVGALRVAKLADYLPRVGWTPIVLTLPQRCYTSIRDPGSGAPLKPLTYHRRPEKTHEVSAVNPFRLASEVRKNLSRAPATDAQPRVNGTAVIEPAQPHWRFRLGNALRQLLVPDEYAHWVLRAASRGREIIETESPDAIWAFYPHASNLLAGYSLSKSSGLPLLLDFRDPWTGFVSWGDVPQWRHEIDESLERRILEHARAITVVNDAIADDITRKTPSATKKLSRLPQGIDFAEAAAIKPAGESDKASHVLRIGYGGTLSRNLGDPERFLKALGRLKARGKVSSASVKVLFVGHSTLDLQSMIDTADVRDMVETIGHSERYEALGMLSECHQLLLINERPGKVWITGKIWDYLTLRRPILALVDPESAAARLIDETRTGTVAPPWDDNAIESELERIVDEFSTTGELGFSPDESALESYSMTAVARKAAEILASA